MDSFCTKTNKCFEKAIRNTGPIKVFFKDLSNTGQICAVFCLLPVLRSVAFSYDKKPSGFVKPGELRLSGTLSVLRCRSFV